MMEARVVDFVDRQARLMKLRKEAFKFYAHHFGIACTIPP